MDVGLFGAWFILLLVATGLGFLFYYTFGRCPHCNGRFVGTDSPNVYRCENCNYTRVVD